MLQRISDSEMEVMQVIWEADGPVTSAEIQKALSGGKGWKATTLLTFLSRLCEKGLLQVQRQGKTNVWTPLVSYAEYRREETRAFVEDVHHGSLQSLIAALDREALSPEDVRALREWFEGK